MDYQLAAAQQEAARNRDFMNQLVTKLDSLIKQVASLEAKIDAPKKAAKE